MQLYLGQTPSLLHFFPPKVKGCKSSTRVNIILHLQDKGHEVKRLNNITVQVTLHLLFDLGCLALAGPISADHQALCIATWWQIWTFSCPVHLVTAVITGKILVACQNTIGSHDQWHSGWGSWGRGGKRRWNVAVTGAMFFHSTGGTANLLPWSIYGSKQDANSGIAVVLLGLT